MFLVIALAIVAFLATLSLQSKSKKLIPPIYSPENHEHFLKVMKICAAGAPWPPPPPPFPLNLVWEPPPKPEWPGPCQRAYEKYFRSIVYNGTRHEKCPNCGLKDRLMWIN